jgi:hypothetical protein
LVDEQVNVCDMEFTAAASNKIPTKYKISKTVYSMPSDRHDCYADFLWQLRQNTMLFTEYDK